MAVFTPLKKWIFRGLPVLMLVFVGQLRANHFVNPTRLGIIGEVAASVLGPLPYDAQYSWISRIYTGGSFTISWRFYPGTDGGIVFSLAQPPERLTSIFGMLSLNTTLYSVGAGITMDANHVIDMVNLRKDAEGSILDLGSGPGVDSKVPLVQDVTMLGTVQNGWQLNPDGTYHLIYNTHAECTGCKLVIHFYGTQLPLGAHGDIDSDGYVTVGDLLLVQRHVTGIAKLSARQIMRGDLAPLGQRNGVLDTADLMLIIKRIIELR